MRGSARVWLIAAGLFIATMLTAPLLPLFDPDEGYYPATAAESVDAGHGWDPWFNGAPRWDKPILSYALIEASFGVFGRSVAATRLPSALQAAALVVIVGLAVEQLAQEAAAMLAAAVLATTIALQVFGRIAHPEIALVLSVITTELLGVLYFTSDDSNTRRSISIAAGFAVGYGVLAKGPVAIVLPMAALVVAGCFVKRWSWRARTVWLHGAIAAAIALAVAVPWYVAMTWRYGSEFVYSAIWQHNVGRYTGARFAHPAGFAYFLLPTFLALLPWTAFVPGALEKVARSDQSKRGILRIVMLTSVATAFVFYSLSASKLPHYALAFVPPLAVLIGLHLEELVRAQAHSAKPVWFTVLTFSLMGVALLSAPWMVGHLFTVKELLGGAPGQTKDFSGLLMAALWPPAILVIAVAMSLLIVGQRTRLACLACAGALVPLVFSLSVRSVLWTVYPWERFGKEIEQTTLPVWMIGPRAPSLTFFAARPVDRVLDSRIAPKIPGDTDAWIVLDSGSVAAVAQQFSRRNVRVVDRSGAMSLVRVSAVRRVER